MAKFENQYIFYFEILDNRVFVKILSISGTENVELKLHLCLPLSSISLYGSLHDDGMRMEKSPGFWSAPPESLVLL